MNVLTNKKFAVLFPGQGAQTVGMGEELSANHIEAKEIYDKANDILGVSISDISWTNKNDLLNKTENTQPALLVHSYATWVIFQKEYPDLKPSFTAGHSLGQFTALIASGILSFESSLKLVKTRSLLMKKAGEISPGSMAAIIGMDVPSVEKLCQESSSSNEMVQLANDNCPGQIVVSGSQVAVNKLVENAKDAGARKAIPLSVSVAAHSYLMGDAQEEFNHAVDSANYELPIIPIIGNYSAKSLITVEEIKLDLKAQLTNRVRWTESMQLILSDDIEAILEIGSGSVLSGLMKRIDRKINRYNIGTPSEIESLKI